MVASSGSRQRDWPLWSVAGAIAAAQLACFWPLRSRYLYEYDSVQFALGAREFDIAKHQPHPPGYPIWVLLVRWLDALVGEANTSMVVLSMLFALAAAVLFFRLAAPRHGQLDAALLTTCLVFSPLVVFHNTVATTYTVDLLMSVAIALLAARAWSGSVRAAVVGAMALALFAGLRQSGAVLMAPLMAVAAVRACWYTPRRLVTVLVAGGATLVAWLAPTAYLTGGLKTLLAINRAALDGYLGGYSVFFGAPPAVHSRWAFYNGVWLLFMITGPILLAVTSLATRWALRAKPSPRSKPREALGSPVFHALWLVPNLGYVFLLHAPKPGYLMLSLPPLVLLIGGWALGNVRAVLARLRWPIEPSLVGLGLSLAVVGMALSTAHYDQLPTRGKQDVWQALHLASHGSVAESDRTMEALRGLFGTEKESAHENLILTSDGRRAGANHRKLGYYLPHHAICTLWQHTITVTRDGTTTELDGVPDAVRRLYWIRTPGSNDHDLRVLFPATRRVLAGQFPAVFESYVGKEPIHARIPIGAGAYLLHRNVPARLGDGFGQLEREGDVTWVWSLRDRAELAAKLAVPGTVRLVAQAHAPLDDQRLVVLGNGRELGAWDSPKPDRPVVVELQGHAGDNELVFTVNKWNGHPTSFARGDRRPIAVRFRRIWVQVHGRGHDLIPQPREAAVARLFALGSRAAGGRATAPTYDLGQRIDFASPDADPFLGPGWGQVEKDFGRWTVADEAQLSFRLLQPRGLRLVVHGLSFERQRVEVELNGRHLGTWTLDERPRLVQLEVPEAVVAEINRLVFELPDSKSPHSVGLGQDRRQLGMVVRWLELLEAE